MKVIKIKKMFHAFYIRVQIIMLNLVLQMRIINNYTQILENAEINCNCAIRTFGALEN